MHFHVVYILEVCAVVHIFYWILFFGGTVHQPLEYLTCTQ